MQARQRIEWRRWSVEHAGLDLFCLVGTLNCTKAIGVGRKQIRRVYLRTTILLGAPGALVGALLGILLSWGLSSYSASSLFAISAPFSVDVPVLVAASFSA